VKKKTGRPAGPVRGGVAFRPKIEKRIGKFSIFKYLYENANQFEFKQVLTLKDFYWQNKT
jgi:hypothetical protein